MKKIFLTLLLSFAILSCETPTQTNSEFPSVVDSSQYEEIANAFNDALNSQDVDLAMSYFSDDAVWSFPNGVQVEGKEAISSLMQTTSSIWTSI
ncbi:MAG: nuclear transport factor 2 family protein, partial [Cryomorphaceae bacterium]|nr:nuclear transport factor 2 family protein [Cryomorphaceae bacterium]